MAFHFMKTGTESANLAKTAAAEAEAKKALMGKMFRFWLVDKEKAKITFIDGDLSAEGFLIPPRWYEHNLFLHGEWNNHFVCPEKTNPDAHDSCPICESGDRPSLVAAFTIIDHRTYKGKNDKIYKDTKKLMVVKPQVFELLNNQAVKRGGLAGATFEVTRLGDKASAVGSVFDFEEKRSIELCKQLYVKEFVDPKTNQKKSETYFTPADYETEIVYRTGDELRKLGMGSPESQAASPAGSTTKTNGGAVDYSQQL